MRNVQLNRFLLLLSAALFFPKVPWKVQALSLGLALLDAKTEPTLALSPFGPELIQYAAAPIYFRRDDLTNPLIVVLRENTQQIFMFQYMVAQGGDPHVNYTIEFYMDGTLTHVDDAKPFTLGGTKAWNDRIFRLGTHILEAVVYIPDRKEHANNTLQLTFIESPFSDVPLKAKVNQTVIRNVNLYRTFDFYPYPLFVIVYEEIDGYLIAPGLDVQAGDTLQVQNPYDAEGCFGRGSSTCVWFEYIGTASDAAEAVFILQRSEYFYPPEDDATPSMYYWTSANDDFYSSRHQPSLEPSRRSTTSGTPSDMPSRLRGGLMSGSPSDMPNFAPSDLPSLPASDLPSSHPSDLPSGLRFFAPSEMLSQATNDFPSGLPSDGHNLNPARSKTFSANPSDKPSLVR